MGAVVTDEPRLVENDVHVCVAKARARDKSLTYSEALAYYESLSQKESGLYELPLSVPTRRRLVHRMGYITASQVIIVLVLC